MRPDNQAVTSRADLIALLQQMLKELEEIGARVHDGSYGWYNFTLAEFLEAMTAALESSSDTAWPSDHPGVWEGMARMLGAGKSFE